MMNPLEDCLRVLCPLIAANDIFGTELAERAVAAYVSAFPDADTQSTALNALGGRLDELGPASTPQGEDFLIQMGELVRERLRALTDAT